MRQIMTGKGASFLEVGKVYSFRTVTMIYVGRLSAISDLEFLVTECSWIPDTERWNEYLRHGKVRENEPYVHPVVLNRASMLDITEFPTTLPNAKPEKSG